MGRNRDRWVPPAPGGAPPTEPMQSIDLYPNPLPPPEPFVTRDAARAAWLVGFDSLSDDEARVARLWLAGKSCRAVCRLLQMDARTVKTHWQNMRRKLRRAVKSPGGEPATD